MLMSAIRQTDQAQLIWGSFTRVRLVEYLLLGLQAGKMMLRIEGSC